MSKRFIIAGGGTGGHIFPAVAIANALKKIEPTSTILFVGAKGKMEMEKVPQAGFEIKGLDIAGFNRSSLIKNITLPYKLAKSFFQVRSIFKKFKPDAVIGVGGYSSFPVLRWAQAKSIPTFLHESNSFAGKSNILLGKKATKVFTASTGMEKFFPAEKIILTGNPIRKSITGQMVEKKEALRFFDLEENRKTLLVIGGSLGAKAINEAVDRDLGKIQDAGLQLIWQTGKPYSSIAKQRCEWKKGIWVNEFITEMENAYAAADVVISRSGAMAVTELAVLKKAAIFVPFPYAAEGHQEANAMQLVKVNAALMVQDSDAAEKLVPVAIQLANDEAQQQQLKENIGKIAISNADERIANEILNKISK